MALKSSREGLRKELVDYLGNIIIDENLKQNIINSIDDVFINNEELSEQLSASVNILEEEIINESSARESADSTLQENINAETLARESADSSLESNKANKSDVLSFEEIQASTDLSGKIASASALNDFSYLKKYIKEVPIIYTVVDGTLTINYNVDYYGTLLIIQGRSNKSDKFFSLLLNFGYVVGVVDERSANMYSNKVITADRTKLTWNATQILASDVFDIKALAISI